MTPPDRPPAPTCLRSVPSWLLNQVSSRANKVVADALGQSGSRRQYAVLAGLEEFGPISQAELSRRLGLDRSDLVAELNSLERDGLARREPDKSDPRRNALHITAAGAVALQDLHDRVRAGQEALLAPLSVGERAEFVSLLQRLLAHHAS
ncbi:DNA-binding transcriptional regulator, MarR family [Quadrisphaera granulorum]|uniref:DNA-binding MarR family transcriptional regulator n=2 Tax=Quadrisphaera granulorum TaxID=317664 RepID=A0A315ZN26_9ACTN|nr:DNA-binding MarR family transcriptional regulator [Quadrisphaera granulorum]SZE98998.1 DNA-binding transcriptional regulator, MarR family [Quadrisphaera granulorum]